MTDEKIEIEITQEMIEAVSKILLNEIESVEYFETASLLREKLPHLCRSVIETLIPHLELFHRQPETCGQTTTMR